MLALSRKKNESIVIGDGIEVTVVDIQGDRVRLAIAAPKEIPVWRKEVYDAIASSNREAGSVDTEALAQIQKMLK